MSETFEGDERTVTADHLSRIRHDLVTLNRAELDLYDSVQSARENGVTWELVGQALNMTKQSASVRFSKPPRDRLAGWPK